MFQWGGLSWLHISAYLTFTCMITFNYDSSIVSLSTWGFSWGKGLLSACPCQLSCCITCTECKDAAYCYWCSMVSVHVCLLMTTMSCAKTIEILFGMWTWVGPRNNVLVWGPGSPKGKGQFSDAPLLCGFRQNSLTTWLINFSITAQHLQPVVAFSVAGPMAQNSLNEQHKLF